MMRERLDRYFLRGCFADTTVEADPGSGGAEFAVDDGVAAGVFPYTKLVWGSSGVFNFVSAGATALPIQGTVTVTGVATSAKQDTGNTSLASIDGKITAVNTGAVVVASSALPSGASTSAKQDSEITLLAGGLPAALGAGGGLKIDGSGTAVPVSGTVAVTHAGLTELAAAINGSSQMDVNIAASGATLTVASHAVTNAGTFAVQVDGAALTALQKIDDPVLVDDAAFTPGSSSVMMAGFEADEGSTDSVDEGDAGAARMTLDRKQIVATYAHTAGGWSPHSHISDSTNQDAEVVKNTAGQLGFVNASNVNAAAAYVKFYDSAATSEETDTPVLRFLVPGNTAGAGLALNLGAGIQFTSGICYRITTGVADSSSAGASANEVILNLGFK